jgi:glutamate synthase (NADPH/NADH) large chain
MTGGMVVVLGDVGDNFGAGMTGGMAFVYDINKKFNKKVNPETVVWQMPETEYWISCLKNLVQEHYGETNSDFSKKIIENFDKEIYNFIQVCPKEMIDKLKNPISLKSIIKEVS